MQPAVIGDPCHGRHDCDRSCAGVENDHDGVECVVEMRNFVGDDLETVNAGSQSKWEARVRGVFIIINYKCRFDLASRTIKIPSNMSPPMVDNH